MWCLPWVARLSCTTVTHIRAGLLLICTKRLHVRSSLQWIGGDFLIFSNYRKPVIWRHKQATSTVDVNAVSYKVLPKSTKKWQMKKLICTEFIFASNTPWVFIFCVHGIVIFYNLHRVLYSQLETHTYKFIRRSSYTQFIAVRAVHPPAGRPARWCIVCSSPPLLLHKASLWRHKQQASTDVNVRMDCCVITFKVLAASTEELAACLFVTFSLSRKLQNGPAESCTAQTQFKYMLLSG